MKTIFSFLSVLFVLIIITTISVHAQPPSFPSGQPDQAPIDGGLGLLAAAGGAYAFKKLKNRKEFDEIE